MKNFRQLIKENFTRGDEERHLLNEVKLNRVLKYHFSSGFILISSDRGERTVEENNKMFKQLKSDVREAGYSYILVYGGFIENKDTPRQKEVEERTLLVPNKKNHDGKELFDLGVKLAKKYSQESFLYKPDAGSYLYEEGDKSYYITPNGEIDMKFDGYRINDATQTYFTKLYKSKSKVDRRITFEGVYIHGEPHCVSEAATRYGEIFISKEFYIDK